MPMTSDDKYPARGDFESAKEVKPSVEIVAVGIGNKAVTGSIPNPETLEQFGTLVRALMEQEPTIALSEDDIDLLREHLDKYTSAEYPIVDKKEDNNIHIALVYAPGYSLNETLRALVYRYANDLKKPKKKKELLDGIVIGLDKRASVKRDKLTNSQLRIEQDHKIHIEELVRGFASFNQDGAIVYLLSQSQLNQNRLSALLSNVGKSELESLFTWPEAEETEPKTNEALFNELKKQVFEASVGQRIIERLRTVNDATTMRDFLFSYSPDFFNRINDTIDDTFYEIMFRFFKQNPEARQWYNEAVTEIYPSANANGSFEEREFVYDSDQLNDNRKSVDFSDSRYFIYFAAERDYQAIVDLGLLLRGEPTIQKITYLEKRGMLDVAVRLGLLEDVEPTDLIDELETESTVRLGLVERLSDDDKAKIILELMRSGNFDKLIRLGLMPEIEPKDVDIIPRDILGGFMAIAVDFSKKGRINDLIGCLTIVRDLIDNFRHYQDISNPVVINYYTGSYNEHKTTLKKFFEAKIANGFGDDIDMAKLGEVISFMSR